MSRVRVRSLDGLRQEVVIGKHVLVTDLSAAKGGDDTGPEPYDLLLASLGACISVTLQLYARRKGWPLREVHVEIDHEVIDGKDCPECRTESGPVDLIVKEIRLVGELDDTQVERLKYIATRCLVNLTLMREVRTVERFEVERPSAPVTA